MIISAREFRARTGERLSREVFRAHWEKARDRNALHRYVGKEDSRVEGPWEWGVWTPAQPGRRSDLTAVQAAIDADPDITELKLYEDHFSVMLRYHEAVFTYRRIKQEQAMGVEEFVMREGWQTTLGRQLEGLPDPREIIWVCDPVGIDSANLGNNGKSYFVRHWNKSSKFCFSGGKHADILYAYQGQKVIFLDAPRDQEDRFPYSVLEVMKNGFYLSTKYRSEQRKYPTPHLVVMANFHPDVSKMSADRWNIINI